MAPRGPAGPRRPGAPRSDATAARERSVVRSDLSTTWAERTLFLGSSASTAATDEPPSATNNATTAITSEADGRGSAFRAWYDMSAPFVRWPRATRGRGDPGFLNIRPGACQLHVGISLGCVRPDADGAPHDRLPRDRVLPRRRRRRVRRLPPRVGGRG